METSVYNSFLTQTDNTEYCNWNSARTEEFYLDWRFSVIHVWSVPKDPRKDEY